MATVSVQLYWGKSFDFMTPADSVRGWRCKTSILPQFCASFDVCSCRVLPESGGVGTPAETLFTMGKGLKEFQLCDSRRLRKKPQDAQDDVTELICLMPIFGVGKVYRIWTPKGGPPQYCSISRPENVQATNCGRRTTSKDLGAIRR